MTVKEKIIALFEANRGLYLSGEEIATRLDVTRSAVWKAVKALQEEGYPINAVTNKGYCLAEHADMLSAVGIGRYLNGAARNLRFEVYKTVDSTNDLVRVRAVAGELEGFVSVADTQTKGRGRLGRSFYSPAEAGVYMSLLLRPRSTAQQASLITSAAAVAVCEAIEIVSGCSAQIKWVNDVWVDGKKVCGILTEAALSMENGTVEYAVLGIGVNASLPSEGYPEELRGIAGALFGERQSDLRNRLAAEICNRFMVHYSDLETKYFIDEYRRRSLILGQNILVLRGEKALPALALAIDDECHLRVRYADGNEEDLSSGEISITLPRKEDL